ncbi:MAG: Mercuric transport protein MerT [Gimesia sp.]|uniref:Mercuric transport protein MerT n=1 Tax=Gimesia chilikensis TaxID=2605989 RepID=A0A517PKJ3_9PLAN|nr:mercuric transporter MerT family protein [Gimesia chilikensis]MBN73846.1 Mercuric transport protein MerT [Gimesia sp.]QDT19893.1 Copper-transporting P-type ATPase [Gimesia chilikensis]
MTAETTTDKRLHCPSCNKKAKRVSQVTLRALLKDQFATEIGSDDHSCCDSHSGCTSLTEDTGWRYCDSSDCDVVYFSETGDISFTKSQLNVPVGVKETSGERPLCYCFGHSVASIKNELRTKEHSDALEDIRDKMKAPGCHCETSNPSGSCCLGSVSKGIRIAQKELELNASNETPTSIVKPSTGRVEKFAQIGTVFSAIMASACCWLPLLLLAVGVSGAGIAATLETYRPLFIIVTFGFLGSAFYFTYRPKKFAAGTGHGCCPTETMEAEDCCTPKAKRRFNMMSLNKVMLWGVTVLAVAFLFFPSYVGLLFGTGNNSAVTENMHRAVFQIEGMTCEGCATTVAQAIRQVPGVVAVEISYEKRQAAVGVEPGSPIPKKEILAALKKAGYSGKILSTEETSEASDHIITATTPPSIDGDDEQSSNIPNEFFLQTVLNIEGMTCEECAKRVSEMIHSVPGITDVHVDFESGRANVQSPACCAFPKEAVLSAVEKSGFHGKVIVEETPVSTSSTKQ